MLFQCSRMIYDAKLAATARSEIKKQPGTKLLHFSPLTRPIIITFSTIIDSSLKSFSKTSKNLLTWCFRRPSIPDICHGSHGYIRGEKICHVEKFQISMHDRCGEFWNFSTCGVISHLSTWQMWRNLNFLHMWSNFRFLLMTDVEKSEISPHVE